MTSARKLNLLFVSVASLFVAPVCSSASSFDDLRKQYPDSSRLLTLASRR
jgi:hypothetical protein